MSTLSDQDVEPDVTAVEDDGTETSDATGTTRPAKGLGLFRAFWRWHFYASVIVVPIMAMLAVTGLAIMYAETLDPIAHPEIRVSVPTSGGVKPLVAQEAAVQAAYPGKKITAVQQGGEDRATFFTLDLGDDHHLNVYVDPYSGKITGAHDPKRQLSDVMTVIHGHLVFGKLTDVKLGTDPLKLNNGPASSQWNPGTDLTLGDAGDRVIELGACWAIVMTITGYYLFLKGRGARLKRIAKGAKAAAMRNDHARFGAVLGIGFLLLVASGLPWTGVWGNAVQNWATGQGSSLWGDDPGATSLAPVIAGTGTTSTPPPWAEGAAPMPASMPGMDHGTTGGAGATPHATIDQVVAAAQADGAQGPFYVTYPDKADGVYSVLADQWHDSTNPAYTDVSRERTVHVDQYSGKIVGRYAYDQYSAPAKLVSQGIALHEGRRLGSFNRFASTAFCLGVLFLCVTGPLLWWKRRPKGTAVGAPRGALPLRRSWPLAVALVALGVFMPLFGASVLLVLAFDQLVLRRVPKLATMFNRA